jgi:glycosyltransferase involved in cell wall biosynthesis
MRLGLIARADNSGLGVQCWEFSRHMQPAKTLVIDVGHLHNDTTDCNKATYLDRYPGATVSKGWSPEALLLTQWLRDLDVVFSAEIFYNDVLVSLARRMGVRTVLQPNFEFLRPYPLPDMLAVPSRWRWDEIPEPKILLPVPIALDRFTPPASNPDRRHFLHVVGRPAIFDRNGTPDLLAALPHVKSSIRLTLKCQDRDYLHNMTRAHGIPSNVELLLDSSDTQNYWENYSAGDVMILPRRYGGLCLPANEALGAGMPVIMTDVDPNNAWLPREWLTPAFQVGEFQATNRVDVFRADPTMLAAKIDEFASDDDFYNAAKTQADELAKTYSWDNLLPEYEKVLTG